MPPTEQPQGILDKALYGTPGQRNPLAVPRRRSGGSDLVGRVLDSMKETDEEAAQRRSAWARAKRIREGTDRPLRSPGVRGRDYGWMDAATGNIVESVTGRPLSSYVDPHARKFTYEHMGVLRAATGIAQDLGVPGLGGANEAFVAEKRLIDAQGGSTGLAGVAGMFTDPVGLLTGAGAYKVAGQVGLRGAARLAGAGVAEGAGYGGVFGYDAARGRPIDDRIESTLTGAVAGTALGGALGGAIGAVAPAASRLLKKPVAPAGTPAQKIASVVPDSPTVAREAAEAVQPTRPLAEAPIEARPLAATQAAPVASPVDEATATAQAAILKEKPSSVEVAALTKAGVPDEQAAAIVATEPGVRPRDTRSYQQRMADISKKTRADSGITLMSDPLLVKTTAKVVGDALVAGKWAAGHTYAAVRWLTSLPFAAVRTMSQMSKSLLSKFGNGIRSQVPKIWKQFNAPRNVRKNVGAVGLGVRPKKDVAVAALAKNRAFLKKTEMRKAIDAGAQGGRAIKQGWDYLTDPVIDRVRRVSPRLFNRLYTYTTEANRVSHRVRSHVDPKIVTVQKLVKGTENSNALKSALLSQDSAGAIKIANQISPEAGQAVKSMIHAVKGHLNYFYLQAKKAGLDVAYLDDFWPRSIKGGKVADLRKVLHGKDVSRIDDAIAAEAKRLKVTVDDLDDEIKRSVIGRTLAGYGPKPLDAAKAKEFKKRKIGKIPDELLHFYEDFHVSFDNYSQRMSEKIARRKLFGGTKKPGDENLAGSIAGLMHDTNVTGKNADEIQGILDSVFGAADAHVGGTTALVRNFGYAATIGQFTSTMRQFGDLTATGLTREWGNTAIAMMRTISGDIKITLNDLGLDRVAEELAGRTGSGKALDKLLSGTGFRAVDRFMKNVHIEATRLQVTRAIAHPNVPKNKKLLATIRSEFGKDADDLFADLAKNKKSELAMTFYTSRVDEIQPLTRLSVPQGYLEAMRAGKGTLSGYPVLAYQLKTFSLRRLGMVRRLALGEIVKGAKMIKAGDRAGGLRVAGLGAARLMYFIGMIATADGGITLAQHWLLGKKLDPASAATDASLQVFGLNGYALANLNRGQFAQSMLFPPALGSISRILGDTVSSKPISEKASLRMVPGVGNIYHNRLGGAAERNAKEKAKVE